MFIALLQYRLLCHLQNEYIKVIGSFFNLMSGRCGEKASLIISYLQYPTARQTFLEGVYWSYVIFCTCICLFVYLNPTRGETDTLNNEVNYERVVSTECNASIKMV